MNFNIGNLYFSPTQFTLTLGILSLLIVASLCVVAVVRSARRGRTTLLEIIRLFCTLVVVLMLWAPEFRETAPPNDSPKIAILYDDSYSMQTLDAKASKLFGDLGEKRILTRQEWTKLALADEFWKPLEENKDGTTLIKQAFSADTPNYTSNREGSDYYKPILQLLEDNDNLKAIVIIGDGDSNIGNSPSTAAQKALLRRVPIYTLPVGRDSYIPDLEITSLSAPKYGIAGEAIQVPFSIRSSMKKDRRTTVTLTDKVSGKKVSKEISIGANSVYNDSILWRLDKEREYKFEFKVAVLQGELLKKNNVQTFSLSAQKENIKVLVIESKPRWEYRFIRNALSRDPGVDLDCLLLHPKIGKGNGPDYIQEFPKDLAQLQKYDVIFLGDVGIGPGQLTAEQCDLLSGLVHDQSSGIVFIPGSQGNIFSLLATKETKDKKSKEFVTQLGDLIPVELDPEKKQGNTSKKKIALKLTNNGKKSLLTMLGNSSDENYRIWKNLPGFHWFAPVVRAKTGTDVLATHSTKRGKNGRSLPLLVTQTYGKGKVLFLAHDSAWKWRRGVEDLYHYRFWGQVARWMSYKRNRAAGENLRLSFSTDKPKPGDTVIIEANAFDANGAPLQDGSVVLEITQPNNTKSTLTLDREKGDWGAYIGRLEITEQGSWEISAHTSLAPEKKVTTSLETLRIEIEKLGQPAKPDTLKEMASISHGEMITAEQIPQLTEKINSMPERSPKLIRTPLWNQWILMASLIGLLAIFWTGRKLNGSF